MFFMSVSSVGVNREKWEFQEVEKMREREMERMIIKIKKKEGGMKIQKTFPNLFFNT